MKISVIVPFHDEVRYLADCLDSLKDQTFQDFEVILVCDNCKTNMTEVLSERTDSFPMKLITNNTRTGVAAARNAGLTQVEGEYVYFLDCDDYIEKDTFEQMTAMGSVDLVYGDTHVTWYKRQVYYENGQELDEKNIRARKEFAGDVHSPVEYLMRGGMRSVSVHSLLIKRELLMQEKITFDEDKLYLSDYAFVASVLNTLKSSAFCEEALYIARKHNDPINLPALIQTKDEFRVIMESMWAYESVKEQTPVSSPVRRNADHQFIRFVVSKGGPFLREASKANQKEAFAEMRKLLEQIDPEQIREQSRYTRKTIKVAMSKGLNGLVRLFNHRAAKQTLKRITRSRAQLKKFLYRKVFANQPVFENTVLVESFFGKSYSDSPKYIFEYLNQKYPGKYKYVWILNSKKKLPYPAKQVKRFSFRYYYYLARCKYIVFNSRQPEYFIKRKGNVFLETWHGTPLKKLVFDMEEVTTASPLYKQQFYTQTRSWDYLVAPNEFSAEIFGHAFMYDGPLLRYGYPRNDILYREDKTKIAEKIKKSLGISQDKKVILYAPTWRDDEFYGSGQYKFTLKLDLEKMREAFGDKYVIILRTHYFVADFLDVSEYEGFAYNLSRYDDIAELYLISDLLITDYSSVFFDYANLRRPMLFYTYDLEKYRDVLRGFYIDMKEELPGPLLNTTEEVIYEIQNLNSYEARFKEKYKKFYDKYCEFDDGHATENIVREVFSADR